MLLSLIDLNECMKSLLTELYERYKRRFVVLFPHIFIYKKTYFNLMEV